MPAALARSATSSPTFLALAVLSPSKAAQVGLQGRRGREGLADAVVDDLHDDVPGGTGHDEARTRGVPGIFLRTRKWRRWREPTCAAVCLPILSAMPWLLTSLSDLAADVLAGVAHALALVRLGLAELADVGGDLADVLLVDALDRELGGLSTAKVMPSGASTVTGWLKPSANSSGSGPWTATR